MIFSKILQKYFKKYFWAFLIGFVTLILIDWVQLYIPDLLGEIVKLLDVGYKPDVVYDQVLKIAFQVIVIAVVMAIGRVIWRLTLFRASTGIECGIRQEMFEKAEKLSVDFYRENKVGNVMSWITSDTEEIQEFFGWGTVMLVDGIFLSLLVIIKMLMVDWLISLIIFVPIILIVVWGILVERFMVIRWDNRQKAFDKLYDFSQESIAGIRVIKSFVKETKQLHLFAKIAKQNQEEEIKFVKMSVIFDVLIEIIIAIVIGLLIGIGGWFVYSTVTGNPITLGGHSIVLTPDKLVVFITYFISLVWPLIALGQIITMSSRAKGSLHRIERFLMQNESVQNAKDAVVLNGVKGNIEFNHLSFQFPDAKEPELKDITLKINAGEIIGIVGRIGSGKTTFINTLSRLYNVPLGSIFVDGVDIMLTDVHSLRENIAYVPQDNFLFEETLENNIKFGESDIDISRVEDAAKFSDVFNDIKGFPNKFETVTGERGVTLSGGQKQRIAISRAFVRNAPIMILDDSVSAVDIKTEETILENIRSLRKGKTTLVVASRVSTVSSLDKIIVLNDGKIEAFDKPSVLAKTSETYKKMVTLQKLEQEMKGARQ